MKSPELKLVLAGFSGAGKTTVLAELGRQWPSFKAMDLGGSAAQSVVLMAIVISLTVLQFRYVERKVNY